MFCIRALWFLAQLLPVVFIRMLPVLPRTKKSCLPTAGDVFYVKSKVEGLIQTTDQQFSLWDKRTPDGFNPQGKMVDQPGVHSGLLSVWSHYLKALEGVRAFNYSVLAHQLQQEESEGSIMTLVTVNPKILPDFPIYSFKFESWGGTGEVESDVQSSHFKVTSYHTSRPW